MFYNNKNRKARLILAVLFGVFLGIYLVLPKHVLNALQYGNPDLDDYRIFEYREVRAGKPDPWSASDNINKVQFPDSLQKELENYDPVAFLVIQNQEIVYEKYWEGYSANSYSNSFSAAKGIVGLLIGIAIDDGLIDSLDQSVGDFLPEFTTCERKNITLRNLLTMSAGTNWEETYTDINCVTTQAYYGNDLQTLVSQLEGIETPGKKFNYQSINTQLLAMVLNRVTGKTLSAYASEKIWRKIGATHDALWSLDKKDGIEKAFCCFNSNARDFARLGQLVLNKGKWNGVQIVSESFIEKATQPASYLIDDRDQPVDFYGLHWWIIPYDNQEIPYMRGILGQYIFALPDQNAVVVRLGHKRSAIYHGEQTDDIYLYLDIANYILNNQDKEN